MTSASPILSAELAHLELRVSRFKDGDETFALVAQDGDGKPFASAPLEDREVLANQLEDAAAKLRGLR